MKLGELFIEIVTKGDANKLKESIRELEKAERKTRRQIELQQKLAQATSEEEKSLLRLNAKQQQQIDNLKEAEKEQSSFNNAIMGGIGLALRMGAAISGTIVVLDRLGNSLLKANQQYITFGKQTGISISSLNKMSGLASLSGMNLSPEQVASDITSLQQKIYRLGLTGEGSGIFAQLGINPMGMNSDDFIKVLRQRTQGMSAGSKSYILDQLGLSQEWLNVLELTNDQFAEYIEQSKQLQLSEKERKHLAEYTAKQQRNNMRWELAKQKFLIALMPTIQTIMEAVSSIALKFAETFGNEDYVRILRDIALLMGVAALHAGTLQKAIKGIFAITGLKALGTVFGAVSKMALGKGTAKGVGKFLGKRLGMMGATAALGAGGAAATGGLSAVIAAILEVVFALMLIYDIVKPFFVKQEADNEELPEPTESQIAQYRNLNSSIVNHFHNNPQPALEIVQELDYMNSRFLAASRI